MSRQSAYERWWHPDRGRVEPTLSGDSLAARVRSAHPIQKTLEPSAGRAASSINHAAHNATA